MFAEIVNKLASRQPVENPGDYREDGILFCGTCRTQKQAWVELLGQRRLVTCVCKCEQDRLKQERHRQKEREHLDKVARMNQLGISDATMRNLTFAAAERTPEIIRCWKYVQNWKQAAAENVGLIFCGDCGGGKTFAAACIANALVDSGYTVVMTSMPKIITAVRAGRMEGILEQMRQYDLAVIDDLGAEAGTPYEISQIFQIIDERYKSRKPLIVTTNLPLKALQNPQDMSYTRIYDRILAMCTPMRFQRAEYRREDSRSKADLVRQIFA